MIKRVALVTGGARGIGLSITNVLRAKGYEVLAPTRQEMDLNCDQSIDNYLNALDFSVDILINCAGVNVIATIENIQDQVFESTFQINVKAPLRLMKTISKGMQERHWGRIVNISSIWSAISKEGRATYSASKAAIDGITRTAALEYAPHGILVNSVAPGYVNTALTRQNNSHSQIESIQAQIPILRLAEPEEIAEVVAFLVSETNTYLTGQTIFVDGGYLCK